MDLTERAGGFKAVSRLMMDRWISMPDGFDYPAEIYGDPTSLRPTSTLIRVDTKSHEPQEFTIDILKRYGLPSGLPDWDRILRSILPAIAKAVERQRPAMGRLTRTVGEVFVAGDYLILPQKIPDDRSNWCVGLLDVSLLLPTVLGVNNKDATDLAILQLLREGASAKEIAAAADLSFRTVQHRMERLKRRFRARNIGHLVAMTIAADLIQNISCGETDQGICALPISPAG